MNKLTDTYTLQNGYQIPVVGFGTWQTPDGETAVKSVEAALKDGYRHIDTAAVYGNEASVGEGIRNSGVPREDIFVTSKLWNTERGYEKTVQAFEQTLEKLQLDYLDLYLIHWPSIEKLDKNWQETNLATWRAFEKLYKDGKIKAIGVSNFLTKHLEPLIAEAEIKPMVDQIEYHPGYLQKETVDFCKSNGILVEAWSPLGTGKVLDNETLKTIAGKYGKSSAQVCIRWCLQTGTLPLPKSVTPSRILENTNIFDFELTAEDVAAINELPFIGGSKSTPDDRNF